MNVAGQPIASQQAAEKGRTIADEIGDGFVSRHCRVWLAVALGWRGGAARGDAALHGVSEDARAAGERTIELFALTCESNSFAFQGKVAESTALAKRARETSAAFGGYFDETMDTVSALTALAAGNGADARAACESALAHTGPRALYQRAITPMTEALLACGDLAAARRFADEQVSLTIGNYQMNALVARAHVAMAQEENGQAERDSHAALALVNDTGAYLRVPEALEVLARLACGDGNHRRAARLFGASEGIRFGLGTARWPVFSIGYDAAAASTREALGDADFDAGSAAAGSAIGCPAAGIR